MNSKIQVRESGPTTERFAALRSRERDDHADEARRRFLSRVSHELRTPLSAVTGFAQLLAEEDLSVESKEFVQHILYASSHLLGLINELLDIAAIEAGHLVLTPEVVDVSDLLSAALALVKNEADQHHVDVRVTDATDRSVEIHADRRRALQVLLNILSNAVKYNQEGGTVWVTTEVVDGTAVRFRITDNGRGIEEQDQGSLFLAFERGGQPFSGAEGSGIGLAVSKALVEQMGGRIGMESLRGVGSTFWFDLPHHSVV